MCVASLVSFSFYLPAFIAYVFPASLPLAGRFFLDGWPVHGDMMRVDVIWRLSCRIGQKSVIKRVEPATQLFRWLISLRQIIRFLLSKCPDPPFG